MIYFQTVKVFYFVLAWATIVWTSADINWQLLLWTYYVCFFLEVFNDFLFDFVFSSYITCAKCTLLFIYDSWISKVFLNPVVNTFFIFGKVLWLPPQILLLLTFLFKFKHQLCMHWTFSYILCLLSILLYFLSFKISMFCIFPSLFYFIFFLCWIWFKTYIFGLILTHRYFSIEF